jgi:membrane protein
MPNTNVQILPAAIGAVLAGVMWESGKWGFRAYIEFSTGYAKLYGSIGLVPLFLMWIYLTWLIVLLGLQIAHSLQIYRVATSKGINDVVLRTLGIIEDPLPQGRIRIVDPASILLVAATIARRFYRGESSTSADVAEDSGIDETVIVEMMEVLAAQGCLHRIAQDGEEGAFVLAKPPESIQLADVLALGERMASHERGPSLEMLGELTHVRKALVGDRTLAELVPASQRKGSAEGSLHSTSTPAKTPPPAGENTLGQEKPSSPHPSSASHSNVPSLSNPRTPASATETTA